MISNIEPKFYFDKQVFEHEKKAVFKRNWLFVAFQTQLNNHNDFITHTIGDVPIVIQNIKGSVKAFINICSHRFSLLQTETSGNRPLLCPYHGWSYDYNGVPTGIPKKPLFKNFSEQELCEMKLKEFTLDKCGNLYFISIEEPTQTLREYLGSFYEVLSKISTSLGHMGDVNQMTIKANRKIIVENTLESYHVNLIHANTFRKLGASGLKFDFTGSHSAWYADLKTAPDDPKLMKVHKPFLTRPFSIDNYHHYLIFPNLLVSTTYGISYNFSLINPVSASETNFVSYVFMSKCDDVDNPIIPVYENSLVEFNREVFKEDKDICEFVQKGVQITDQKGVLSLEEERVHAFQNNYIINFNQSK